ncbi:hypothetical protein [Absidia glauca]|uniref:Uncharacterized protein n=1 Tax=Absidia glauca TaxID=4829 RepID=A0A168LQA3_ABSGL|nr:hypothetical protein [Absidia glauca]
MLLLSGSDFLHGKPSLPQEQSEWLERNPHQNGKPQLQHTSHTTHSSLFVLPSGHTYRQRARALNATVALLPQTPTKATGIPMITLVSLI